MKAATVVSRKPKLQDRRNHASGLRSALTGRPPVRCTQLGLFAIFHAGPAPMANLLSLSNGSAKTHLSVHRATNAQPRRLTRCGSRRALARCESDGSVGHSPHRSLRDQLNLAHRQPAAGEAARLPRGMPGAPPNDFSPTRLTRTVPEADTAIPVKSGS